MKIYIIVRTIMWVGANMFGAVALVMQDGLLERFGGLACAMLACGFLIQGIDWYRKNCQEGSIES